MKRVLILICFTALALSAVAQNERPRNRENDRNKDPKITELVSNLTATQKTRIEAITRQSGKTIDGYKKQLDAVRDSIRSYMSVQKDQSKALFPLFEREAYLQSQISKAYYKAKVDIDKILTPEQYRELREKTVAARKKQPGQSPHPSKQKGH